MEVRGNIVGERCEIEMGEPWAERGMAMYVAQNRGERDEWNG